MTILLRILAAIMLVATGVLAQSARPVDLSRELPHLLPVGDAQVARPNPPAFHPASSSIKLSYFDTSTTALKWPLPANYGGFAALYFAQRFTCPGTGGWIDTIEFRVDEVSGDIGFRVYDTKRVTFPDGRTFIFPETSYYLGDTVISAADITPGDMTKFSVFHQTGGQWQVPKEFFLTVEYTTDGSGANSTFSMVTDSKVRTQRSPDSSRSVMFYLGGSGAGVALLDSIFSYQGQVIYPNLYLRVGVVTTDVAAPVITSTAPDSAQVGQQYIYAVTATGNPPPTFSLIRSPGGMSISQSTGILFWQPTALQVGSHLVTVRATNNKGYFDQSFYVTVRPGPGAPKITSTPPLTAQEGVQYVYQVSASGVPTIGFTLLTKPTGMSISSSTGRITWTPNANQIGSDSVVIRATNGDGFDDQRFVVQVSGTTVAPVIQTSAPPDVVAGNQYVYDIDATGKPDPTYHLKKKPAGMVIDTVSGFISWTPTRAQKGANDVTVEAWNIAGAVTQDFSVTVWTPPIITSAAPETAKVGELYVYNPTADAFPAAHFKLTKNPTGMTIDTTTGHIEWTPLPADKGSAIIFLRATNRAGAEVHMDTIHVVEGPPVSVRPVSALPSSPVLDQNYPNPFSRETSISFFIPGGSKSDSRSVTLKIYDALGREVQTLIDRSMTPGRHTLRFTPDLIRGGTYFYRLRVGSTILTRVMHYVN